jgi:hypothetical protein
VGTASSLAVTAALPTVTAKPELATAPKRKGHE